MEADLDAPLLPQGTPPAEGEVISDEKFEPAQRDAQDRGGGLAGEDGGAGVSATQLLSQPGALPSQVHSPVLTPEPIPASPPGLVRGKSTTPPKSPKKTKKARHELGEVDVGEGDEAAGGDGEAKNSEISKMIEM